MFRFDELTIAKAIIPVNHFGDIINRLGDKWVIGKVIYLQNNFLLRVLFEVLA